MKLKMCNYLFLRKSAL